MSHRTDLRTGGRWSWPQRIKNQLLYVCIRAALALVPRLPAALLVRTCRVLGCAVGHLVPPLRRRVQQNLERALGTTPSRALVSNCFARAGENLALTLLLRRRRWRVSDCVSLEPESRACLDLAMRRGRGVLFLSGHLGPFEWLAATARELGYPVSVVVRESYDPRLNRCVDAHRVARGVDVIHRGQRDCVQRILAALRAGHIVGLLADLPGRAASSPQPFLGGELELATGPALLARRSGAAVLVGGLQRRTDLEAPANFTLKIQELVAQQALLLPGFAQCFGQLVLNRPADWLWLAVSISCKK